MQISELTGSSKKVDVEAKIVWVSEIRSVNFKDGTEHDVMTALIRDKSGSIALSLFDDLTSLTVGQTIRVSNGYTTSFNGKAQLNAGKYGSVEVV